MFRTLTTAAVLAALVLTGCGSGGDAKDTAVQDYLAEKQTAKNCEAVRKTYEAALDTFYWKYFGTSIGNPTGDDLVTDRMLESYNTDYYEIVQGDPSMVRATEACR
jgi:outer membrane murein-binding lipoprotein Lpp